MDNPQTFHVPTHAEIWATVPQRRWLRTFKRDGALYRVIQIKRGPDIGDVEFVEELMA